MHTDRMDPIKHILYLVIDYTLPRNTLPIGTLSPLERTPILPTRHRLGPTRLSPSQEKFLIEKCMCSSNISSS